MGYCKEAEVVTLDRTSQSGVYRASIPVQGDYGLAIEYWRREVEFWSVPPMMSRVRIVPLHDYYNKQ